MSLEFAILGLGEAGSLFARDLLQYGTVYGYDPDTSRQVAGLVRCSSIAEAVQNADVILSLNWARVALEVAQHAKPYLRPNALFADLNTASPKRKLEVATVLEGIAFVDVALLNPVPGNGLSTPALASGVGAEAFLQVFLPFGMPVEALSTQLGEAAGRKLARSVFYKGLAACVGEALEAGRALGCETWLRENIGQTLAGMNQTTVERLIEGSYRHALRREAEMQAAAEMLVELGIEPRMASSSAAWLKSLQS